MNTLETQTTYSERAYAMTKQARQAHVDRAVTALNKAKSATGNISELEVLVLNRIREAGIEFNHASGHEQLNFTLEGCEFVRREIVPHLPEGMSIEQVRMAVKIASMLPNPIKDPKELAQLKPVIQLALGAFALKESHKAKELQTAHARNLFSDFVNDTLGLGSLFEKLQKEEPMEGWPADKLDELLEKGKPLVEIVKRAERLRLGLSA